MYIDKDNPPFRATVGFGRNAKDYWFYCNPPQGVSTQSSLGSAPPYGIVDNDPMSFYGLTFNQMRVVFPSNGFVQAIKSASPLSIGGRGPVTNIRSVKEVLGY